jgi:hypothetical protein
MKVWYYQISKFSFWNHLTTIVLSWAQVHVNESVALYVCANIIPVGLKSRGKLCNTPTANQSLS